MKMSSPGSARFAKRMVARPEPPRRVGSAHEMPPDRIGGLSAQSSNKTGRDVASLHPRGSAVDTPVTESMFVTRLLPSPLR